VIFLDLDPAECVKRISGRLAIKPKSIYDDLKTLHEARERYFKAFEYIKRTEQIIFIDIDRLGEEEIAGKIWKIAAP
jgi:thymidylate kinase